MINGLFKNLLKKYGYQISKIVRQETELEQFVRHNKWLKSLKIGCVLDIGANEGQFAFKILALLPNVNLHCFEPVVEPFNKLRSNLQNLRM